MSRLIRVSCLSAVSAIALGTLTGCGIGAVNNSVPDINYIATPMHGVSMGGASPIVSETVSVYVTSSAGYGISTANGGNPWQQQTTSNAVTGKWSFPGGYNCPAGQYVYIVGAGGNTGANATNNNSVLVAALGRCDDLFSGGGSSSVGAYTGASVSMNELSTIAAAYALGPFSSVTGTGSSTIVQIGAPVTNNAAEATLSTCSSTYGVASPCSVGTTSASAGLFHAFLNAANLVNAFGTSFSANSAPPLNANAVVPQQLINSMGNSLVACVNSAGGAIGDGSACGQLLDLTSLPTGRVPAWSAATPTNTFSAMVNLAANPTLSGVTPTGTDCAAQTNIGCFFNLATAQTNVYSPALTAGTNINDYSIAINYPPANGFNAPTGEALDVNDNLYVGTSGTTLGTPGVVPANVVSLGSNGKVISSGTQSTIKNTLGLCVDSAGNGYFGNGSGSSTNLLGIFTFSNTGTVSATITNGTKTSTGLTAQPYYLAIDKQNNVWAAGPTISPATNTLYKSAAGGLGFTGAATPTYAPPSSNFVGLAIDPNQNVWMTATQALSVWPNTGTAGTPAYTGSLVTASASATQATGITFSSGGTAYIDGNSTTSGIQKFTPTLSGATVTAVNGATISNPTYNSQNAMTGSNVNETDGIGNVWVADNNSASVVQYIPAATPLAVRLTPCGNISSNVCGANGVFTATGKPWAVTIDSTGAIWVTVTKTGSVAQIIGSAAPTVPLLSLGRPGVEP